MQRVPVTAVLVGALLFTLAAAAPSAVDAKPRPKPSPSPTSTPRPTPTPTPTPTATPAPSPTTTPAYLEGIDVSYHQGPIDWQRVATAEKQFTFIRATAGTLTADTAYAANHAGAHAAGLAVGSYHFANPDFSANDAANEATWFLQNATIESGDLLPVLDLEVSNGLDPASLSAWAQVWLSQVAAETAVRPIIYTTPTFWSGSMANTEWFARNGYSVLWVANWTAAAEPTVPAGAWAGNGWTFWQHSSSGVVPGVTGAVDLDRFRGTSLPSSLFVP